MRQRTGGNGLSRLITLPQSVWKLNCGVSVGTQTLIGIKHLAEFRRELEGGARLWPFETGFSAPTSAEPEVWLAEIFPSLVPEDPSVAGQQPRDLRQVVSCVLEAARRDASGQMRATLGLPAQLSSEEIAAAVSNEGWMLFV